MINRVRDKFTDEQWRYLCTEATRSGQSITDVLAVAFLKQYGEDYARHEAGRVDGTDTGEFKRARRPNTRPYKRVSG